MEAQPPPQAEEANAEDARLFIVYDHVLWEALLLELPLDEAIARLTRAREAHAARGEADARRLKAAVDAFARLALACIASVRETVPRIRAGAMSERLTPLRHLPHMHYFPLLLDVIPECYGSRYTAAESDRHLDLLDQALCMDWGAFDIVGPSFAPNKEEEARVRAAVVGGGWRTSQAAQALLRQLQARVPAAEAIIVGEL